MEYIEKYSYFFTKTKIYSAIDELEEMKSKIKKYDENNILKNSNRKDSIKDVIEEMIHEIDIYIDNLSSIQIMEDY